MDADERGQNAKGDRLVGAGVARVEVIDGTPTVTKRFGPRGYWWDSKVTARYGDVCAYRDEHSEYIYIWGGPPTYITDWLNKSYTYLARVKAADAFDLGKYEYYWGRQQGWKGEVLNRFTPETAVLWGTGQGQVFWSPYYKCYVLVHLALGRFDLFLFVVIVLLTGAGGGTVFLRTASFLEGPWTPDVSVYTATPINGGLVYAGVAHPYHDPTGKTLVVSYTNNNHIEVIRIVFE